MKKYIIKNADGSEQSDMQAIHESRKEAGETLIDYICDHNEDLDVDDDDYLSPFDFVLEEVECKEVNEVITDFESARKALGGKPNADVTVAKKILSGNVVQFEDVARLVTDINPKHIEALIALNKLFTIAQAWNKEDGFGMDDLTNPSVRKYFPIFGYDNDKRYFDLKTTDYTYKLAYSGFGFNLCFESRLRAEQFGMQFAHLFNELFKFYSIRNGAQI